MPRVTATNITMNYDQTGAGEPLILRSDGYRALVPASACTSITNVDRLTSAYSMIKHKPDSTQGMVCHSAGEWARDDDGDGKREVHCNTC